MADLVCKPQLLLSSTSLLCPVPCPTPLSLPTMSATTTPATSKQSEGHTKCALVLLDEVLELLWMAEPSGVTDDADYRYRYWAEQVAIALVHPAPHLLYADWLATPVGHHRHLWH